MIKHIANTLTALRIICSISLLFSPVFSAGFYVLYLFGGFTDMIDGTIARKTNTASEFGAKLDTIADTAFATASLIKILPTILVLKWLQIWIAVIAVIKIGNGIWGFIKNRKIVSLHTTANKITGLLLFLLPLTLSFIDLQYSIPLICTVATFSAIQEGYYIGANRK